MPSHGCPVPPQGRGWGSSEEPLRQRFCRGTDCGAVFWIRGVYPRMCGGTAVGAVCIGPQDGLSPHVRGNRQVAGQ